MSKDYEIPPDVLAQLTAIIDERQLALLLGDTARANALKAEYDRVMREWFEEAE